jgi:hypothetical protein
MFRSDQLLFGRRGTKRTIQRSSSIRRPLVSIQP